MYLCNRNLNVYMTLWSNLYGRFKLFVSFSCKFFATSVLEIGGRENV